MRCDICNRNFKNSMGLSSHIRQSHKIKIKDYYDKYLKQKNEGICPICEKQTTFHNIGYGYYKFCSSRICINNDPNRLEKLRNRKKSKDEIEKLSKSAKKQWKNNKDFIEKMTTPGLKWRKEHGKLTTDRYKDPQERIKTSNSIKLAYKLNPQLRIDAGLRSKQMWNDPDGPFKEGSPYWDNLYKSVTKSGPNYAEALILDLLNKIYPNEYRYTGDFNFWIGRKNPDFLCLDKKKLIEHFGIYWHGEEHTGESNELHENNRINYFSAYGYKTLIIWENEIDNIDLIKSKIINFHEDL